MRASTSASISWNSSSESSPISRRISASSSCSRRAVSSFISASAAVTTVLITHRRPEIISESSRNTGSSLMLARALQLQADVDEVVRWPGSGVLEGQLVEARRDFLDAAVERLFLVALDEERGVHDHLVADRAVDARRHRDVAQPLQELGDVALRPLLQRAIDQPSVLHAREVGRALLRRDRSEE